MDEVVRDNGVQFTSTEFADFLKLHGMRQCRAALYSPQRNAEVERMNRVLKEGIRAAMAEGKSFSMGIRQTLATYRMTAHATTGVSPASLMLAFPARTPLTLIAAASTVDITSTLQSAQPGTARGQASAFFAKQVGRRT